MPVGTGDGLDGPCVLVGVTVGGSGVPVGLAVSGSGALVGLATGGTDVLVGVWTAVGPDVEESVGSGRGGVLVGKGVGDAVWGLATADTVRVTKDAGLPTGDIGVGVTVARDVGEEGAEDGNRLSTPTSLPATSTPIAHIMLTTASVPVVRTTKGNNRSYLICPPLNRPTKFHFMTSGR